MEVAHTPGPGPRRYTDETINIMKVLHTPLLGLTGTLLSTAGPASYINSRAGVVFNNDGPVDESVQS